MLSENSGKIIISSIIHLKDKVKIMLSNEEVIDANEEAVAEFFLFNGKQIEEETLQEIKKYVNISQALKYAYTIINRGRFTKKEIADKLYKKKYSDKIIKDILYKLENSKLIDDMEYVKDYYDISINRGYGPQRIKKALHDKGISNEVIESIDFEACPQALQIEKLLPKYELRYAKSNARKKHEQLFQVFINLGYDSDVIKEALSTSQKADNGLEMELLRKDMARIYDKLATKHDKAKLKNLIITKLRQKGYNYSDIAKLLEVSENYD